MDSMMPIAKRLRIRNNGASKGCFVLVAFITVCCIAKQNCLSEETQLKEFASKSAGSHKIELSNLFNFEWDTLYVVVGPMEPGDVTKVTGLEYSKVIPDDYRQYIFARHGKIVRDEQSGCRFVSYFDATQENGFVKYSRNSSVSVICKDIAGEVICDVE
jgi:hypothetical protein